MLQFATSSLPSIGNSNFKRGQKVQFEVDIKKGIEFKESVRELETRWYRMRLIFGLTLGKFNEPLDVYFFNNDDKGRMRKEGIVCKIVKEQSG